MTQETALAILKTGANVFLTGEPGSGKTHTINSYVAYLRSHNIEPAITASTGIAATHIGGMTIHSWSGIGIQKNLSKHDLERLATTKKIATRLSRPDILIIDEISMLDADTLSSVDAVCSAARKNEQPFGGMQVILVGDFFQLPPVSRSGEKRAEFAFRSSAWEKANLAVCYLSEQHRHEDPLFLSFLASLRHGTITSETHASLTAHHGGVQDLSKTRLYSHNADVDRINNAKLASVPGNEKTFEMNRRGPKKIIEQLTKHCLSPEFLSLKIGARVMFTKNNFGEGFVNGTVGEVEAFADDGYPVVKTLSGRRIHVEPMEWTVADGAHVMAKIIQLPLRLAWAITIHKSQGMTLDSAVMDLSNVFEYGQGYVALSRIRTFDGLSLLAYNQRALEVNPAIIATDATFRELSIQAESILGQLSSDERDLRIQQFITHCGGEVAAQKHKNKKNDALSGRKKRGATYITTLELWQQGNRIAEIAAARSLAESTIYGHLEKLYIDGKIERRDIEQLVSSSLLSALPEIHRALQETGSAKLTPLFEKFNGKYSYGELRLARMLM